MVIVTSLMVVMVAVMEVVGGDKGSDNDIDSGGGSNVGGDDNVNLLFLNFDQI